MCHFIKKLFTSNLKIFENGCTELNQFCNYSTKEVVIVKTGEKSPKITKFPDFD